MNQDGWKRLIADAGGFAGEGNCPIPAYSEYMPAPQIGLSLYSRRGTSFFAKDDPWGWPVTEYEEAFQLGPGLQSIANQIMIALVRLARGEPAHGIARANLIGNPYWPRELADRAGRARTRSFCGFSAAGAVPHARRQRARALDPFRRQRTGAIHERSGKGFMHSPGRNFPRRKRRCFFAGS